MDWCEEGEFGVQGKIHSIYVQKDSEEGKVWVSFKNKELGGDDQQALDSAKKMREKFNGFDYGAQYGEPQRILSVEYVDESLFCSKVPPIYY